MRRILPLTLLISALMISAFTPTASAALYGVESNGELANSSVTPTARAHTLDLMKAQGVDTVRVNFAWNEIANGCAGQTLAQLRDHNNPCYTWGNLDDLVQQSTARGIQPIVSLTRVPRWVNGNSEPYYMGTRSAEWTRTVTNYVAFMTAAATRYTAGSTHGTIRLWTVWSEPNSKFFFKPMTTSIMLSVNPKRYAQMLGRSAVAIKTANPSAIVAAGPTGPQSTIKPVPYIKAVQAALPAFLPGSTTALKRRWIAAWAHNPYPGITIAPSKGLVKSPSIGMANIRVLFQLLDASPITRGLKVWGTEFGYQTNPPDRVLGIAPALQGRFMGESFDFLDSTRRVTVLIWYGFTDPTDIADWQSGTYFANGTPKVSRLWYQRPISVPIGVVKRGATARVWARSNMNPLATRIAYSFDGRVWKLLPIKGRKSDGTMIQSVRVTRKMFFATWDGVRGPARVVLAS